MPWRLLMESLLLLAGPHVIEPSQVRGLEVAITVDDLPMVGLHPRDGRSTARLIGQLARQVKTTGVPVWGFVCGRRGNLKALKAWTGAGLPLGNHSYSHRAYSRMPINSFLADLLRNEKVLKQALGVTLAGGYFRYPMLDHGHSRAKVKAMEAFLKARRYQLAPVSLDTVDYQFNKYYVRASLRREVIGMYVQHVRESAAHFEKLSRRLYGRVIPLILLVHANPLNADGLDQVLKMLTRRGYRFITLEKALLDKAYQRYRYEPPLIPFKGDRNFLNLVALSRGIRVHDPSGDGHFKRYWLPRLLALVRGRQRH